MSESKECWVCGRDEEEIKEVVNSEWLGDAGVGWLKLTDFPATEKELCPVCRWLIDYIDILEDAEFIRERIVEMMEESEAEVSFEWG